mmetsp:Transcript_77638/g.140126  ORF Transcript_77638/g.140126 Transcript_77638/m.140126 type:complete len:102 (-) Transcript_77638:424-729(-)
MGCKPNPGETKQTSNFSDVHCATSLLQQLVYPFCSEFRTFTGQNTPVMPLASGAKELHNRALGTGSSLSTRGAQWAVAANPRCSRAGRSRSRAHPPLPTMR